jgi:acetate---CoA ligase (ADP-forming)
MTTGNTYKSAMSYIPMTTLDTFFTPQSVAIIGASHTPGERGYEVLKSVKNSFTGQIYPVNPNIAELQGLTTYSSILIIEAEIELAIICSPVEEVRDVLKECVKKDVKGVVIMSSGFSEKDKTQLEKDILTIKKSAKMRIMGPSCLGTYTKELDMLFLPKERLKRPGDGYISFITQSGAVGATIMDLIAGEGVGINKFVSIGSRLDVEEIELLKYFGDDLKTRCIIMYIESTEKGKELIETAKKIVPNKPIIVLKAGKTAEGKEAIETHTGHTTVGSKVYSAAFRQAGIIEVDTTEDLLDYARILANQPTLKKNRLGIITDSGGFGILAADEAARLNFEIPEISKETKKKLRTLPSHVTRKNPLDLSSDATAERYEIAMEALFKDESVDAVVCIALLQIPTLEERIIDVIRESKLHPKPISVCMSGSEYTRKFATQLEGYGIPVYPTPERAVRALKVLLRYAKIIKQ